MDCGRAKSAIQLDLNLGGQAMNVGFRRSAEVEVSPMGMRDAVYLYQYLTAMKLEGFQWFYQKVSGS